MLRLALMLLWIAPGIQVQQKTVGFVLELSGTWVVDGSPLQRGQALPAGAKVRVSPVAQFEERANSFIRIILLNNEPLSRSCDTTALCNDPIILPTSLGNTSSLLERMSQVASRLFSRQQGRFAPTLSRGGANDLPDAVIELRNGKIMLKPLFEHVRPGLYRLDFQQINPNGELDQAPSS